jgi:uncharacterized RDD family membrane protein YckC
VRGNVGADKGEGGWTWQNPGQTNSKWRTGVRVVTAEEHSFSIFILNIVSFIYTYLALPYGLA